MSCGVGVERVDTDVLDSLVNRIVGNKLIELVVPSADA